MVFACKAAKVAYNTAKYHRAQDRQFDEQCLAAMDYAGELLEARAFQRALEGDVEPIASFLFPPLQTTAVFAG